VVLFTLLGPRQATLFLTEYAVLAGVMAEAIRFRLSFDKCISFSALASAVLSIVLLLFVFTDREATLLEFFQKQIDGHFAQSIESLKAIGDKSEELKVVQDFADKASGSLAQAYPSFIVLGTFVTALINYYATRFLWRRIYGYDIDLDIHTVPVRYNFGETAYVDKLSQTPEEFYNELATNPEHPKTSQPTPGDFRRQYQFLQTHYDSIISIHLPHELSGTYQSALNASKRVDNTKINVVDGLSASVGLGLIVMKAAQLAKAGKKHDEISAILPEIISQSSVYLVVKDLSYVVKGGRLPGWVKKVADCLYIRPVLSIKENGSMGASGVIRGISNLPEKMSKLVLGKMDPKKSYNISIGHCNILADGEKLMKLIQKGHNEINSIYLMDIGCALGVHAGPGSLAVAIQPA